MTTGNQRRAFISYSRVNKDFATKLAKELRSSGYPIWFDQFDIPTGSRWDEEVERALHECSIFMIILTPASTASENVKDEIGYAIDHGKRILPILLEKCEVPLRLRRFQYVDFTNKTYEEGLYGAKDLLGDLIEEKSIPMASAPAAPVAEAKPTSATKSAASITSKPVMQKPLMIGGAIGLVLLIVLGVMISSLGSRQAGVQPTSTAENSPTQVEDNAPAPVEPSAIEYRQLTDETGTFTVTVPDTWIDLTSNIEMMDGFNYTKFTVTDNLNNFKNYTADGVVLYASAEQTWSVEDELNSFTIPNCAYETDTDYSDIKYAGKHRVYTCKNGSYFIDVYAVRPIENPGQYILSLEIHIVTEEAMNGDITEQILKSFDVIVP